MHVLGIPESDGIIKTARNDLGVVGDPFAILLAETLRVKRYNLENRSLMARYIRLLLSALNPEDSDPEISMN